VSSADTTVSAATTRPIDVAWAAAAILVPVFLALRATMSTIDLAYHLRLGEEILASRSIPTVDTFTFTMQGSEWVDQQWGAQVILEVVHRVGGWPALSIWRALLIGVSFSLVFATCRNRGTSVRTAALLTIASFMLAAPSLALRPQLLALPLICLTQWLLSTSDRGHRRLVALPLIAWLCATIHGAFLVLLVLIVVTAVIAVVRRTPDRAAVSIAAAVSVIATFLTPLGPTLWSAALSSTSDTSLRELIPEWQPMSLATIDGWLLLLSVIGVAFLTLRSPKLWPIAIGLIPFLVLAVSVRRGVIWWGVVAAAGAASYLPSRAQPPIERESWTPAIAIVGILLTGVIVAEPFHRADPPESLLADAPIGLADAAQRDLAPGSRLFAFQPWASWLEFASPRTPVFLDSRFLDSGGIIEDYLVVNSGDEQWPDVMKRWEVDAIAGPHEWSVVEQARRSSDWTLVHDDGESVLLVSSD
jgi:hypothetical protein